MILEEFDFNKEAIINPHDCVEKIEGMPKVAVACFEHKTFNRLLDCLECEQVSSIKNANGAEPVYKTIYKDKEIALFMMDMGAPGASGDLEEVYAMGVDTVIVYGSCGVLDKNIGDHSVIIPTSAVRDEGVSYHYAPPSDEIKANVKYMEEFTTLLDEIKCSYITGKTWTTDAFYRETREKMERRKAQGCICVDMECASLAAVAQFRDKACLQFFWAADSLDGEEWDQRSLSSNVKFDEKDGFSRLALELAVRIQK
ncbi:MAG: phosphorylase [Lachnospiraceae bacterium]|nr:phosphorylase [Lachnospiraceae bacterium]